MPPAKPVVSTFAQRGLTIIFAALMVAIIGGLASFFYWLAGSTMDIQERTTRIEEQLTRVEQQVSSLLSSRTNAAEEQASSNTRRLEDLEKSGASQ